MMPKALFLALALLAHDGLSRSTLSGTLVVAAPSKDGLVICADRRLMAGDNVATDNYNKLRILGSKAVFVATNRAIVKNADTGNDLFNAFTIVEHFFKGKDEADLSKYWHGLSLTLLQEYDAMLKLSPRDKWPQSGRPPDYQLFQVITFYLDPDGKGSHGDITVLFNRASNKHLQANFKEVKGINGPEMFGNSALVIELTKPTGKPIDHIRYDSVIKRFISPDFDARRASREDATDFGRRFIRYTSEFLKLVPDVLEDVSPICDCVLLSKSGISELTPK
jgi:hypothetical protein